MSCREYMGSIAPKVSAIGPRLAHPLIDGDLLAFRRYAIIIPFGMAVQSCFYNLDFLWQDRLLPVFDQRNHAIDAFFSVYNQPRLLQRPMSEVLEAYLSASQCR